MRPTFKIEAVQGTGERTDTVAWAKASTEIAAKSKAMKMFKNPTVDSVWIRKFTDNEGDPSYQWNRYRNDSDWSGGNYW